MATTTNYGWTTPDDTALVKDGAAAIRTLGSSVDTTTKALNPETTLGDISYRSSTVNTKTRLGIGTTGQVLTVAGGVPSWATPAGGTFVGVGLYGSDNQSISGNTTTTLTFNSEYYDTDGFHSTSSNTSRITIPSGKAGKYLLTAGINWDSPNSASPRSLNMIKNGTRVARATNVGAVGVGGCFNSITLILDLAVADYIEVSAANGDTDAKTAYFDNTFGGFFATYLGA